MASSISKFESRRESARKTETLAQSDLLNQFSPVELAKILGVAREVYFGRHQTIFSPGDPSDCIYLIESGRVKMIRTGTDGKCVILALLGPGDVIDDVTDRRDSCAQAIEETNLYEISRESFEKLIRQNPDFGLRLLQLMGGHLKQAQARIEDLVLRQVPGRVARLLIGFADSYGVVTRDGIRVDCRLTHQDIASLVGSSRVTVTQILNRMRLSKWIDVQGKRVTIYDLEALKNLAEDPRQGAAFNAY